MKEELSREMSKLEVELLNGISKFEIELQNKTEEWKYSPENWAQLREWRGELQALQGCEEMRLRILCALFQANNMIGGIINRCRIEFKKRLLE